MKIFHTVEKVQKCLAVTANRTLLIMVGYSLPSDKRVRAWRYATHIYQSWECEARLATDQCTHTDSDGSICM